MRKLTVAVMVGVLVIALVPPGAAGKGRKQTVKGSIAFPAPYTDDSGCYAGLHRRGAILTQGNNNGVIGYHFKVDKRTWNQPFALKVTDGQGDVDLDIYFYLSNLGTVEQVVTDPLNAGSPPTISYNTRKPGGESDIVPQTAKHVIVCMYGGGRGAGFGASFTYTAQRG